MRRGQADFSGGWCPRWPEWWFVSCGWFGCRPALIFRGGLGDGAVPKSDRAAEAPRITRAAGKTLFAVYTQPWKEI